MNEGIKQTLIGELIVNVLEEGLQAHRFFAGHDALDIGFVFAGKVVGGFEFLCGTDYNRRILLGVGVRDAAAGGFVFEL
jgi:hypothetical protein